jgi:GntR family transcriptional repressor for pyruvate dehydrogenase complex
MEDFQVIQRRKIHQDIAGQVRDLIRDGVLKPGDRLPSERELADRFQVGRGSLREAMRALELQGMVVSRPGSGTFVSAESLEHLASIIVSTLTEANRNLANIFEVRHLLEPHIASLAAERATDQDCDRMDVAIDDQERQITDGETGVEGDTAFHFALAQGTHNSALVKVISTISDILAQSRDHAMQSPGRPQRSMASHRQILHMVRSRNSEGARKAMEHHITEVEPANVHDGLAEKLGSSVSD